MRDHKVKYRVWNRFTIVMICWDHKKRSRVQTNRKRQKGNFFKWAFIRERSWVEWFVCWIYIKVSNFNLIEFIVSKGIQWGIKDRIQMYFLKFGQRRLNYNTNVFFEVWSETIELWPKKAPIIQISYKKYIFALFDDDLLLLTLSFGLSILTTQFY